MSEQSFEVYRDESEGAVGIRITISDADGERTIEIGADEDGNLHLGAVGPNGSKRGKADPSGNGNNPLGK